MRLQYQIRNHMIVLCYLIVLGIFIFTSNVFSFQSPRQGRFLQRDPGPGPDSPIRVGIAGTAANGSFAQRDPLESEQNPNPTVTNWFSFDIAQIHKQYDDGMSLYNYEKNNSIMFLDPKGTDVYIKTGNPGAGSINNALHQKVCADEWCKGNGTDIKIGEACFSFGKSGWTFRLFDSRQWLGWFDLRVSGGLVMEGEIYEDGNEGTVVKTKKTRPAQDYAWIKWMRKRRVGTKDVYSVTRHNCRKYSQQEYNDAP